MSGMKKKKTSASGCSDSKGKSNVDTDDESQDQSYVAIRQIAITRNLGKRIIRAEKWKCPLENVWQVLMVVGVGHQGVVVTLEDRTTRYIVHKLPADKAGDGQVVVAYASGMGSNWSRFDQKAVTNAIFGDYLHQCGYKYNLRTDNCIHAVNRMWELN